MQMARAEQEIYGYIHLPCRVEVNSPLLGEQSPDPAAGGIPLLEKRIG